MDLLCNILLGGSIGVGVLGEIIMTDNKILLQDLIDAIDELNTHYWECDEPRSNPVSYEIGQVLAYSEMLKRQLTNKEEIL